MVIGEGTDIQIDGKEKSPEIELHNMANCSLTKTQKQFNGKRIIFSKMILQQMKKNVQYAKKWIYASHLK